MSSPAIAIFAEFSTAAFHGAINKLAILQRPFQYVLGKIRIPIEPTTARLNEGLRFL